jgi:phage repressor protein C with HTH and peptisase S24 domain
MFGIDPNRLLLETGGGESMLPGIQDGDLPFIDAAETGSATSAYVPEIAGERLVKRVSAQAGWQPRADQ